MPVFVRASRRAKAYVRGGSTKKKMAAYGRTALKGGTKTISSTGGQQREIRLSSMRKSFATSRADKNRLARKHLYLKQVSNGTHRF